MARLALIFLIGFFMYSAISLVSSRYQQRLLYIDIGRAQAAERELEVDWRHLLLERAQLTTSANIDRVMSDKLSMQTPQINQTVFIKESEMNAGTARAATATEKSAAVPAPRGAQ